jgi:tetratricopeptide (TPR) repeat protein
MDKGHGISFSDGHENTTLDTENKNEDLNLIDITTKEIININKNYLDDLEPTFKNSLEGFIKLLNDQLNNVQISFDQKKLLEKQIEGIVREVKNISIYKKVPNNVSTDSTKSVIGNGDNDIACYDKALEIDPMNADAYYKKGLSLSTIEKYAEAIVCYDKALEIDPMNADAYYKKGLSLYYLGYKDEAIACYDKALEINPPIRTCI